MKSHDPPTPRDLAAQLIARRTADPEASANPATPAAVALQRLSAELCGWVGAEGCRVLLSRALTRAQKGRPALANLRVATQSPPFVEGVQESLEANDAAEIAAGIEATMTAMLEMLTRLIGEDLTTRLAEQSMTDAAPDATPPTRKGRRPHD